MHVRLQTRFHRIEGILCAISAGPCKRASVGAHRTATTVDSKLLELAATSVLYLLVHCLACSLRRAARDTSVRSRGGLAMALAWSCCLVSSCSGILAIASCGRRRVFLRQSRLGQQPGKLHQDRGEVEVRPMWAAGMRDGGRVSVGVAAKGGR